MAMAAAQTDDAKPQQLRSSSMLIFRDMQLPIAEAMIVCDVSAGTPRPYVPASYWRTVLRFPAFIVTSGNLSNTAPGDRSFRVAKHQHRRTEVGMNVYAVLEIESTASYYCATLHFRGTEHAF